MSIELQDFLAGITVSIVDDLAAELLLAQYFDIPRRAS